MTGAMEEGMVNRGSTGLGEELGALRGLGPVGGGGARDSGVSCKGQTRQSAGANAGGHVAGARAWGWGGVAELHQMLSKAASSRLATTLTATMYAVRGTGNSKVS